MKAFYQSIHYEAICDRKVRRGPVGGNITFSDSNPATRDFILDYFEETSVQRAGVLHGEYLLHECGMLLVERNGVMTSACISLEHPHSSQAINSHSRRLDVAAYIRGLLDSWNSLPLAQSLPLLFEIYSNNYYHFSLEMIPRARFYCEQRPAPTLIMSADSITRAFQRDLLKRSLSGMNYSALPVGGGIRVRDPIIAHESMSEEGMLWLRQASGIAAQPGQRRIYIRRAAQGTRSCPGGGISETAGFEALLRDFGFETVDFGNGEHGVAEQVAMLEGVGMVLSAHGAALTNLVYLNPELTVIEVIGARTPGAFFMHVAATLGFQYHGLFSSVYDDQLNIVVDLDELYEVVRARV